MKRTFIPLLLAGLLLASNAPAADTVVYQPKPGPGAGKHIVFLTGDEEYRSEEGLPQLAKILSQRHGFKCTVLFSLNQDGTIDPTATGSLTGAEALDSADVIVMLLRFRAWPDDVMKHFVDAYLAGKPIIALRTSTHAFNYPGGSKSPYAKFSYGNRTWPGGFGKQVLGETWVNHWARIYKNEAGNTNKVMCTTLGAATDLLNEDLRRFLVNSCYWGAGLGVPSYANGELVGESHPSMSGFGAFVKGVKPDDLALPAKSK